MQHVKKSLRRFITIIKIDVRVVRRGWCRICKKQQRLHWFERDLFAQCWTLLRLAYLTVIGRYFLFLLYYILLWFFIILLYFIAYF